MTTPTIPNTVNFPTRSPSESDVARRAHDELLAAVAAFEAAEAALAHVGDSYAVELSDPGAAWADRRDWFADKAMAASTLAERAQHVAELAMTLHLLEIGAYR